MPQPARLGHWNAASRWGLAALLFAAALAARFLLIGLLPPLGFPFLTFFPAVLLAAFLCGLWPGLGVAGASIAAAWYWFIGPGVGFGAPERGDAIALVFFGLILVVDCLVLHLMNRSTTLLSQREHELREADHQKDVFIAALAHELRSPISAIQMAARVVAQQSAPESPAGQASQIILRQGQQLSRLVEDLMTATRLRTGKFELQLGTVQLREVIEAALETAATEARAAGRELQVAISDEPMALRGDALRLAQCVANLLNNAMKFTRPGGHIALSAQPQGDEVVVVVRDDGEGISPAAIGRVFERFAQEAGQRTQLGLGLGLALTRDIVTAHGGTVAARSAGKGHGTEVEIRLPRLPIDPAPGAPVAR